MNIIVTKYQFKKANMRIPTKHFPQSRPEVKKICLKGTPTRSSLFSLLNFVNKRAIENLRFPLASFVLEPPMYFERRSLKNPSMI